MESIEGSRREVRATALMAEAERVANCGCWEWRVADDAVTWSEQLFRIFGFEPGAFKATLDAYVERIHPDDRDRVVGAIEDAIEARVPYGFEHRLLRPDGEERTVRCQGEPLLDAAGQVARLIGVCQDVTELKRREEARAETDLRFRSAFAEAPIGMGLAAFDEGSEARLTEVNRALCEITRRPKDELLGAPLSSLCHPEDVDVDQHLRERLLAGELDRYEVEKRCVHEDGSVGWVQLNVSLVLEEGGEHRASIVQVQDITERKRAEEQLRYMADHDALTGLLSRRRFREELDSQIALKRRYGGEGALLLLDVDRLKQINDTHGHAVGDMVLRGVADVLRQRVRGTDPAARLAGDEFAVLMPNATRAEAEALGDALIALVREQRIAGPAVSVSIGIAPFGDGETDGDALLAAADRAMYRAKQRGGTLSQHADPAVTPEPGAGGRDTLSDLDLPTLPARRFAPGPAAGRLRAALAGDELLLYGQPVFDLRSGGIAHRELLVRMRDAHGEVLPASHFLGAAAREHGLCGEIDRWVVRRALSALGDGEGLRLHVNLSGETLADARVLDELLGEIGAASIDPAALAFEVNEGTIRHDAARAEQAVARLARAGSPVVLDGFSAGFGSFEYLRRLPLDQVKIDGAVVRRLAGERPDHTTVRAIVRLATGTHKTTVAKLVDSEALVPLLRMEGVDMAQGYQLAEPTPIAA